MKYLSILFLLLSCSNEEIKPEPIREPAPVVVENKCKTLQAPRYSKQFSELVCALKASAQNVELKSIVLAQWILESGRGTSRLASKFYNFGGLKWREEMRPYASPISYEAWDGRTDYIEFSSPEKFIQGYWHFINRYPYKGWNKFKKDPHGYIKFINHAGYTPPRDYYKKVIGLEKEALVNFGFMYRTRTVGFGWEDAPRPMKLL